MVLLSMRVLALRILLNGCGCVALLGTHTPPVPPSYNSGAISSEVCSAALQFVMRSRPCNVITRHDISFRRPVAVFSRRFPGLQKVETKLTALYSYARLGS